MTSERELEYLKKGFKEPSLEYQEKYRKKTGYLYTEDVKDLYMESPPLRVAVRVDRALDARKGSDTRTQVMTENELTIRQFQPMAYGEYDMVAVHGVRDPQTFEVALATVDWAYPFYREYRIKPVTGGQVYRANSKDFLKNIDRIEVINDCPGIIWASIDKDAATNSGIMLRTGEARSLPFKAFRYISVIAQSSSALNYVRVLCSGWKIFDENCEGYANTVQAQGMRDVVRPLTSSNPQDAPP